MTAAISVVSPARRFAVGSHFLWCVVIYGSYRLRASNKLRDGSRLSEAGLQFF